MAQKPKLIVVIPCLAEEGIWDTIKSLLENRGYGCQVECIIVANHAESETDQLKLVNRELARHLFRRRANLDTDQLKFEVIEAFDLLDKKAGVGMARKIGMDLSILKFEKAGMLKDGVIVCLDGDCTVAENYLAEIENYFERNNANGCSIHFEHPLDGDNARAIIDYELYLRYYINALRWSGFPYAFQTVGSSMAVAATAYVKQGGMNTRKAGEDFYFLNKIVQLERFGDLTSTLVYPSSRKSERVPFGTGREMMEWEKAKQLLAYHPDMFIELKKVFQTVDLLKNCDDAISLLKENQIHNAFISYFEHQKFNDAVTEAQAHTASIATFRKRFFVWMNAFRVMKLLNELSISAFPKLPIQDCGSWLWREISGQTSGKDSRSLLLELREFDRLNAKQIGF